MKLEFENTLDLVISPFPSGNFLVSSVALAHTLEGVWMKVPWPAAVLPLHEIQFFQTDLGCKIKLSIPVTR